MTGVLLPEDLHRRFALGQSGNKVGFCGRTILCKMSGTDASSDADPGIHHDAIQLPKAAVKFSEYGENLIVLVHVQLRGFRAYAVCSG